MSRHHDQHNWNGHKVRKARANIRSQLPLPCVECGKTVTDDEPWDVGHVIPISLGGHIDHYGAAHRSCNRRNGGRMGGKISRTGKKPIEKRIREW